MRFSDNRAVIPHHHPDKKYMVEPYVTDARTRRGLVDGLRTVGSNSKVRLYNAISDSNGDFLRDKRGNVMLVDFIKEI